MCHIHQWCYVQASWILLDRMEVMKLVVCMYVHYLQCNQGVGPQLRVTRSGQKHPWSKCPCLRDWNNPHYGWRSNCFLKAWVVFQSMSLSWPRMMSYQHRRRGNSVVGAHDFHKETGMHYNTNCPRRSYQLACRIWSIPYPYKSPLFLRHHPASRLGLASSHCQASLQWGREIDSILKPHVF